MCQGIAGDLDLTEQLHKCDDELVCNDMHTSKAHEGIHNTSHKIPLMHVICKESYNNKDDSLEGHENVYCTSKNIVQTHKVTNYTLKKILNVDITCQVPFNGNTLKEHKSAQDTSKVIQQTHKSVRNIATEFSRTRKSMCNTSKISQGPESVQNISKETLPMCMTCLLPFNANCALECHKCEHDSSMKISEASESVHNIANIILPMCIMCQEPFNDHCMLEGHECSNVSQSHESVYNTPKYILQAQDGTKSYTPKKNLPLCFICQVPFNALCAVKGHECIHKISKRLLAVHASKQDTSKKVTCEVCLKTFGKRSALMRHLLIHTGERPYICDICKSTFAKKINLDRHQLKHSGIKPFSCEICQRGFQTRQHLDQHHLVHTGERPYECSICQKTYSQKSNLNRHLITHIEKKPYFCNICRKGFAQKPHLLRHLRTHTGEKPFECDVCQKSFSQRSGLDRHLLIHTNERSFTCDICPKAFRRQNHLDQHVQTHYRKSVHNQTN